MHSGNDGRLPSSVLPGPSIARGISEVFRSARAGDGDTRLAHTGADGSRGAAWSRPAEQPAGLQRVPDGRRAEPLAAGPGSGGRHRAARAAGFHEGRALARPRGLRGDCLTHFRPLRSWAPLLGRQTAPRQSPRPPALSPGPPPLWHLQRLRDQGRRRLPGQDLLQPPPSLLLPKLSREYICVASCRHARRS